MSVNASSYHQEVQDIYASDFDSTSARQAGNERLNSESLKAVAQSDSTTLGTSADGSNPQLGQIPPGAMGGANAFNAVSGSAILAVLASKTMSELKNLETALTLLEDQLHQEEMSLKIASHGAKRDASVVRASNHLTKACLNYVQYSSAKNIGKEMERLRSEPQMTAKTGDRQGPTKADPKNPANSNANSTQVTIKKSGDSPTQSESTSSSAGQVEQVEVQISGTPPIPPRIDRDLPTQSRSATSSDKKGDEGQASGSQIKIGGSATASNSSNDNSSPRGGGRSLNELQNAGMAHKALSDALQSTMQGASDLVAGELDYLSGRLDVAAQESGHTKEGVGKAAGELKNFMSEILQMLSKMSEDEAAVTKMTIELRS
ncbi:MAG: hypothetical protein ACI9YB_001954 [Halioglobus sp.]|jgi:hypothetical protein